MSKSWDHNYYEWLISRIETTFDSSKSHRLLYEILHDEEFIVNPDYHIYTENDWNRYDDGQYLRVEYAEETNDQPSLSQQTRPPSILEVLFALALRMSFASPNEIYDDPGYCFRDMLENMDLWKYTDDRIMHSEISRDEIEEIVDNFVVRRYAVGSKGSPFVFKNDGIDYWQDRSFSLWDMMHAYLYDNVR